MLVLLPLGVLQTWPSHTRSREKWGICKSRSEEREFSGCSLVLGVCGRITK